MLRNNAIIILRATRRMICCLSPADCYIASPQALSHFLCVGPDFDLPDRLCRQQAHPVSPMFFRVWYSPPLNRYRHMRMRFSLSLRRSIKWIAAAREDFFIKLRSGL